jgi:hypothetical protein
MTAGNLGEKARDFVQSMSEGDPRRPTVRMPPPVIEPSGVFDYRVVRRLLFSVVSLAIIAISAVGILAVWELLTPALAWKVALTFIIAVLALTLFCLLNEGFADRLRREED